MSRFSRWQSWQWLALFWLIGSILRLWQYGAAPMWHDEVFTMWVSTLPLGRMLLALSGDVHPPAFYVLEWMVSNTMANAWTLRAVSVIASIGAMLMLYPVARRMGYSERVAILATALMAVVPFQRHYAQEARMYAVLELLVLLGIDAIYSRRWEWMCAVMTLLLYTHNYGALYCAMLGVWALVLEWQRPAQVKASPMTPQWTTEADGSQWQAVVAAGFVALSLYGPWIWVEAQQMAAVRANWWSEPTQLATVVYGAYALVWAIEVPDSFQPLAALVLYATLAVGAWRTRGLTWLWLLAVPVLALALEVVYRPIWLVRAMIGVAPALYLMIAQAWAVRPKVAAAAWVPLLVVGMIWYAPYSEFAKGGGGFTLNTQAIRTQWQEGDIIMHLNSGSLVAMRQYDSRLQPQYLWPEQPGNRGTLTRTTLDGLGVTVATLDEVQWTRCWLVWGAGPTIGQAEDTLVHELLARYPHLTIDHVKQSMQEGGIWLLSR